jgi:hypothetical protein
MPWLLYPWGKNLKTVIQFGCFGEEKNFLAPAVNQALDHPAYSIITMAAVLCWLCCKR